MGTFSWPGKKKYLAVKGETKDKMLQIKLRRESKNKSGWRNDGANALKEKWEKVSPLKWLNKNKKLLIELR